MAEWRKRATAEDLKTGPKEPRSTVLTAAEEAMIIAFRRHTLLPLDDCLYALQPSIPHLTRSALHRCLQRHGISRLPDVEGALANETRRRAIGSQTGLGRKVDPRKPLLPVEVSYKDEAATAAMALVAGVAPNSSSVIL